MKFLYPLSLILLLSFSSIAQVNINYLTTDTPETLVDTYFGGAIFIPTNVQWNGNLVAANTVQPNCQGFDNTTNFPFSSGLYLTSSQGAALNDPDLNQLATGNVTNGGILEFDFIALGDSLIVQYMFASAEYPSFVCSQFNDAFGFFISGPGINGSYSNNAENIALVPNSNVPVAINTVNSGTAGSAGNPTYCSQQDPNWTNNSNLFTTNFATYSGETYTGGTIPMFAGIELQCGETYHIKFAVANVTDQSLNSGVYIKKCIFPSVCSSDIDFIPPTNLSESYEGCTDAGSLVFNRVGCGGTLDDPMTSVLHFSGVAQNGVDYTNIPDSITFAPYQTQIVIPLSLVDDNITEGSEMAMIEVITELANGYQFIDTVTFEIFDRDTLITNVSDIVAECNTDSVDLSVLVNQGLPPYSFVWSDGATTQNNTVETSGTELVYTVETKDACGFSKIDEITVTQSESVQAEATISEQQMCPNNMVNFNASANMSGVTYYWDFGGELSEEYTNNVSTNENTIVAAFTANSDITMVATNGNENCNDTVVLSIEIVECGCTDPNSENYNPTAILDDGSCKPSEVVVVAPNVFTPFDNNGMNSHFYLNTENAKSIELTIFNRWGNEVFKGTGNQQQQPKWNGRNKNGDKASSGTYFYIYKIVGFKNDSIVEGQGFLELVK